MAVKAKSIKNNMKVLFVNRPDNFTVPGGDTTHILKLKEGLEKLGVHVDIAADVFPNPSNYDLINVFNLLIPQHTLRQVLSLKAHSFAPVILTPFYWDRSESIWGEEAVSIAVEKAKDFKELSYMLKQIADGNMKIGYSSRFGNNSPYPDYAVEQKTALKFVDHVIPISFREQQLLTKNFEFPNEKCTAIKTGTDFPLKKSSPDKFIKKYGVKDFVLITGRVETRKNQLMLLCALKDSGLPIVISGGQQDKRYLELCKKVAPPNTHFVGRLDDEMLMSARAAARVHALPSWWECAGISHMEASLDGCNIVVGNKAAEPEYFLDGAYYCDPADVDSVRNAVLAAYKNYDDDKEKISTLQKYIYKNYDWNVIAQKTLEVYHSVFNSHFSANSETLKKRNVQNKIAVAFDHFMRGEISKAAHLLPSLFELDPDNVLIYELAAKISMSAQSANKAIGFLQYVIQHDSENVQIMRLLAKCYLTLGNIEEAEKILNKILVLNPNDTDSSWLLSRAYIASMEWNKVRDALEGKNIKTVDKLPASIIVLTYNSSKTILDCLKSVFNNLRTCDEVIIVDNKSTDKTCAVVDEFIFCKSQFKFLKNEKNLGFSAGTNVGISNSKNPIVVLLNPDTVVTNNWIENLTYHFDDLHTAAVGPLSNYVAGYQKVELYLKDKLLPNMSAQNLAELAVKNCKGQSVETKLLVGFCMAVRRDILDKLGLLDENLFLGNDDLELCWRLRINGYKLKVACDTFVYHEGQHSFNTEPKPLTQKLVQESTDALYAKLKNHYGANNVPTPFELWGMNWFTPTNALFNHEIKIDGSLISKESINVFIKPKISIISLTFNGLEWTKKFYESLIAAGINNYELILIDNASTDETPKYLSDISKDSNVKVIFNEKNIGFPAAVNQGILESKGEYIVVANNDIVLTKGCLDRMIQVAESHKTIGLVGPISNEVSGFQKDENAVYKSIEQMHKYAQKVRQQNNGETLNFPRIAFLFTLIKREVIEKIGGLDERFSPGNYEDDDFCLRAQIAGFKTVIAKDVFIHHYGSKSFKADGNTKYAERLEINKQKFISKWGATPDEIWIHKKQITPHQSFYPINSNKFDEQFERARIFLADKELDLALESISMALENYHKVNEKKYQIEYPDLLDLAANIAFASGQIEIAKRYFEEELTVQPNSSSACAGLGEIFFTSQEFEAAKAMYEWGVKNNPENASAIEGLVKANLKLGLSEDDFSLKEEVFIEEKLKMIFNLYESSQFDKALSLIDEYEAPVIEHYKEINDFESASAFYNLKGYIYLALEQIDFARSNFEIALNTNAVSSQACTGLGEIFYKEQNFTNAKTMFEWGVKNNPENKSANESLAKVNLLLGFEETHNSLTEV